MTYPQKPPRLSQNDELEDFGVGVVALGLFGLVVLAVIVLAALL